MATSNYGLGPSSNWLDDIMNQSLEGQKRRAYHIAQQKKDDESIRRVGELLQPKGSKPEDLPYVPSPLVNKTQFVGQDRAQDYQALQRVFPNLPRPQSIQSAPTRSVLLQMMYSGIDPKEYDETNLLGNTFGKGPMGTKQLYVSPNTTHLNFNTHPMSTMGHELAHSVGRNEQESTNVSDTLNDLIRRAVISPSIYKY